MREVKREVQGTFRTFKINNPMNIQGVVNVISSNLVTEFSCKKLYSPTVEKLEVDVSKLVLFAEKNIAGIPTTDGRIIDSTNTASISIFLS